MVSLKLQNSAAKWVKSMKKNPWFSSFSICQLWSVVALNRWQLSKIRLDLTERAWSHLPPWKVSAKKDITPWQKTILKKITQFLWKNLFLPLPSPTRSWRQTSFGVFGFSRSANKLALVPSSYLLPFWTLVFCCHLNKSAFYPHSTFCTECKVISWWYIVTGNVLIIKL